MAFDIVRIDKNNGDRVRTFVSTFHVFHDAWLPLCRVLNLQFVPLLGDAGWLEEEERIGLIAELAKMREFVISQGEDYSLEWIVNYVDEILECLRGYSCKSHQFILG